jgi:transposase-like protein
VALLIDGLHIGEHSHRVALGIDTTGAKHALGLWDGSTENAARCQASWPIFQSRGLRTDRSLLIILDGSKALHKAVTQTFGSAALIHRCHVHKLRNILAAAILEAVKGLRRLKGHRDMPQLVAALRARDRQLGIVVSAEKVGRVECHPSRR